VCTLRKLALRRAQLGRAQLVERALGRVVSLGDALDAVDSACAVCDRHVRADLRGGRHGTAGRRVTVAGCWLVGAPVISRSRVELRSWMVATLNHEQRSRNSALQFCSWPRTELQSWITRTLHVIRLCSWPRTELQS